MTKDLIRFGGNAIEGMHLIGVYQSKIESQDYLEFGNTFYKKFSYEPSFVSIMAYDAFNVLTQGIKASDDLTIQDVKNNILLIERFNGLEDSIEMNSFGDSKRSYLMYKVINGEFIPQY
jgi:branched-chain amino acid transport system substrate-binding protein